MRSIYCLFFAFIIVCSLYVTPVTSAGPGVHFFDCKECHLSGRTIDELGGANVCLKCHTPLAGDITLNDGAPPELDGHTDGRFTSGDASNAFGHGTGVSSAYQTSHTWSAPSDTLAAAGATAPSKIDHPEYYSRYGVSTGKITCSRCHNPHAPVETNPKLLIQGAGSADLMCRTCHAPWDQSNNHGWLTHPIVANYNSVVAAQPDKYLATINNKGNAEIQLVSGGISCTSCHGVHFVDSDSSTPDGVANIDGLNKSDGRILRADGSSQTDKASLCQSCHKYVKHGDSVGEQPGCLVCHSGHCFDADFPNYFVLRKSATTITYNTVTGLDYSSPSVLDKNLKYTFWNDRVDGTANGYCEKCHGDAKDIGSGAGNYHTAASVCTDCHNHPGATFVDHSGASGSGCIACHGHNAGYEYAPGQFSEGRGTSHSHSTHTENDADDLKGPFVDCDACHDTSNFPYFKSGSDDDGNGVYTLDETDVCDTCHSPGGSYDGVDDIALGAKPNWSTGIYNGATLLAGKEKWCATCHDEAPALISGVSAPNVIGDETGNYIYGQGWGYYKTGHGLAAGENYASKGGVETLAGRPVECNSCHDFATSHIDGIARTYDDGDSSSTPPSVYRQGYRLKLIDGQEPMLIPRPFGISNNVNNSRTCFQVGCHDSGPLIDSANMNTNLVTGGINRHTYHLGQIQVRYPSDWSGANTSAITCVNCHNVHGSTQLAMVRDGKLIGREPGLQMWYKTEGVTRIDLNSQTPPDPEDIPLPASDGTAWIGGSSSNLCVHCHAWGIRTADREPFQDVAQAPVLNWAGTTGLINKGVVPDSATGLSSFTFRVSYSDSNNDSPNPIEVWVDQNDSGSYELGEKFVMTETENTDTNFISGKIYTRTLTLGKAGDNQLNYRFYALDSVFEASGTPTTDSLVTILNNPPTLDWTTEDFYLTDGVNPGNGGNGSTFTFRVSYTDIDNEVPTSIQIWVDENDNGSYEATEQYTLTEVDAGDSDYTNGKLYSRALPLAYAGNGELKYRFYAADAQDDATGSPITDSLLTVQPGANSPPVLDFVTDVCTSDGAKPQAGANGANFDFTVRYADMEGQCPPTASDIQLWIDENDNLVYERYDLTEIDPADTNCTDGKLYTISIPLALAGDNLLNYRFYASDGIDTAVGVATTDHSVTVVDALKVRPAGGSGWYSTIQSAIDAVNGAHTVLVYQGTYNENLLVSGSDDSNTPLRSVCGPNTTIINGNISSSTVTFNRYSSGNLLDGFQVTGGTIGIAINGTQATINNCQIHDVSNGNGISAIQDGTYATLTLTNSEIYNNSSDRGGGVRISRGTGHTISNTIIRDNAITGDSIADGGGGLHAFQVGTLTVSDSIISGNTTSTGYSGGGLYAAQVTDLTVSDTIIRDNISGGGGGGVLNSDTSMHFIRSQLTGNTATEYGGAIRHPSAGSNVTFENCIMADNQASQGGMAFINGGTFDVVNSTIANNQSTVSNGGMMYNQLATVTIRNSILWGNLAATTGHITYFNGGSMLISDSVIQSGAVGNFTNPPFFDGNVVPVVSGFTSGDDPWFVGNGNYHIQAPSPALDNASASYAPPEDIDGTIRPQGAADDIGAYEFIP